MNEDAVLVERAQQGDQDAFAELYERYFDRLYDFLARLVRNDAEAADLAQDTFLKAMNSLTTLTKGASFKSWLFTIARNNALNRLERASRSQPLETENDDGEQLQYDPVDTDRLGNPEEAAEAQNMAALVWEAAKGLDPKSYSVLHLTLREGLESAEIADVLGVTKNNAYVMVNRMKQALEGAVGALMLLRNGRRECLELDAVLARLEITEMSPDTKRAIDRHASTCENCRDRRAKMASPFAIFAGLPLLQPADGVKESILFDLGNAFAQVHGGGAGTAAATNTGSGAANDSSSISDSALDGSDGPDASSLDTPFSEDADSWMPAGAGALAPDTTAPAMPVAALEDDERSGRRRKVLAGIAAVALLLLGGLGAIALSASDDDSGENQNLLLVLSPTLPPTSTVVAPTSTPELPTPEPEVTPINSEVEPELPIAPGGSTPPTPRPQPPLIAATATPDAGGPGGGGSGALVVSPVPTDTPTVPPTPTDTAVPLATETPTATATRTRTPTPTNTPCVATMSASPGSITFSAFPDGPKTVALSVSCGGSMTFTTSAPAGYAVFPLSGSVPIGGSTNITVERLTPSASDEILVINPSVGANINVTINAP